MRLIINRRGELVIMRKKKNYLVVMLIVVASLLLSSCSEASSKYQKGATYKWDVTNKHYENFTDLGDYVIDVDEHTHFDFDRALEYSNKRYDKWSKLPGGGCSALGTQAKNGDVLIGRNLDLTVSQFPCYITHVNPVDGFKYKTINFTYDELFLEGDKYKDLLKKGKIDEEYYNALPLLASDSFNEKGLYIEYNMRAFEEYMICSGTNPDCPNRICTISLPYVVAANCATVNEALDYIKNHISVYTLLDKSEASGWNLCFMIGDATGEYGLIEIARNEVMYLPYQHGQGNYYVTPKWNVLSEGQSGYGRLQFGIERIDQVQTEEDMAELMGKIMWRNEILNVEYAKRDEHGHVHFLDKDGKPSLDWRSDNVNLIPVNKEGKYVDIYAEDLTEEAKLVKSYKEATDRIKSNIGDPLKEDIDKANKYNEYLSRNDLYWASDDNNFEELQKGLIDYYKHSGIVDKLNEYYKGNEKPLRDDSFVWTTALSISANCTQKRITVKFWEKPNTVLIWQF